MNNLSKKILAGVALTVVGVSAFLGITYSKYINRITGNGETEIAKWNFKVNQATEDFATIKLADTYDKSSLLNGKIAPGTSGSFDIVIDATDSEVGVKYVVDFLNETNKPENLKFSYDTKDGTANSIKVLDEIEDYEEYFTGIIDADDTNKIRTLTVNWEWAYETGKDDGILDEKDIIDTNNGLSALDYTFDVLVTGTQVAPTK